MSKEVKITIFVVVVILTFVLGLNFLKGKGFLDNNQTYYAIFDQVSGMNPSDPIVVNGYKVGKVGELELIEKGEHRGHILVQLIIKNEVSLPDNSTAILFSADLLGAMNVKMILGDSKQAYEGGDTINTNIEASLFEEIGGEITPLTDKLEETIDNVNKLFDFEQKNVQSLNYTVENINKTLSTFQKTGDILNSSIEKQLEAIDRILINLEKTTVTINNNEEDITKSIQNVEELTGNLKKLDLETTLNNVNSAISDLETTIEKVDDPNTTLGALLNERELYDNLEKSSKNLELLLLDLRLNPKRYLHISVFGKNKNGGPVTEEEANEFYAE